jgi:predicted RecB family nuclease
MAGEAHKVNLQEEYSYIKFLVSSARQWLSGSQTEIAPVALNEHCPYCCYEKPCRAIAENKNDITLLDRVTPKVARQYHKKGIFTVEQLSYLFKPRKNRKAARKQTALHKPELQALAIRNSKIYVHEAPHISRQSTELFLDIEGIPDQDTYYLIGLLVSTAESEMCFSFWADSTEGKERIWLQLIDIIKANPQDAPVAIAQTRQEVLRLIRPIGVQIECSKTIFTTKKIAAAS